MELKGLAGWEGSRVAGRIHYMELKEVVVAEAPTVAPNVSRIHYMELKVLTRDDLRVIDWELESITWS